MTLLPIVERELRQRSRKWTTYWLRAGAGLIAGALTGLFLLIAWIAELMKAGGGASAGIGQALFFALAWMAFVFSLFEGARATTDCLSEEKREGTLGLLFLTDLRGFDVVFGKFVARSLNSFYGLLSVYPVLGVALLIGGVAPAQFWRMTLVLTNTLFLATTTGVLVSALCRRQLTAWAGTLGLIFGVTVVPAALSLLLPQASLLNQVPSLAPLANVLTSGTALALAEAVGRISPATAFLEALSSGYGSMSAGFWWTLFAGQIAGWVMLGLASFCLPRTWQEPNRREETRIKSRLSLAASLSQAAARRKRATLIETDAVVWLAGRDQPSNRVLWMVVLVCIAGALLLSALGSTALFFTGWWLWPFRLIFQVWLAFRACHFFVDARNSGALELLLTTPLPERDLIRGQMTALRNYFLAPLITYLAAEAVFTLLAALLVPDPAGRLIMTAMTFWGTGWQIVRFVGCLFATVYTGMWLALVLKKPGQAFGLTLLLLLLLPGVACGCGVDLGIYLLFIFLPKSKLDAGLRRLLTGDVPRPASLPLPPPLADLPPVIHS
jgi:hypothetical protein